MTCDFGISVFLAARATVMFFDVCFNTTTYPFISISNQADGSEGRHPSFEFIHPVVKCGLRHQHHVGARDVPVVLHVTKKSNGLEGLSQTLWGKKGKKKSMAHYNNANVQIELYTQEQ